MKGLIAATLVAIPMVAHAECEWHVRDQVTQVTPDEIRFGVQGGARVPEDPVVATAVLQEAGDALARDVQLLICVPTSGPFVAVKAAAST